MSKKDSGLFNRNDMRKVAKTKRLVNTAMLRIENYLTGIDITVTTTTIKNNEEVKHIASLKHYDLDKAIKFFKSIVNTDARKHAKSSRKKILKLLKAIKENKTNGKV